MANLLAQNPMVLDGSSLSTILLKTQIKIKHFEFVEYANGTASVVTITNQFGDLLWSSTGNSTGDNQRSGNVGWVQGLQETTHTDGFLLVYFD
jgi:hypothetical protein